MPEDTKRRLLKRAAELMGKDELAIRLGVPVTLLEAWTEGQATMPDRKLLKLADALAQFTTKP